MKKTLTMTYPSKKYLSKLLHVDSNMLIKRSFVVIYDSCKTFRHK